MRCFAESGFQYMRRQIDRFAGSHGKLLFMMPSLPPQVVLDLGHRLASFCLERQETLPPLIKVSTSLANAWMKENDAAVRDSANEILLSGWYDEHDNLTGYRNLIHEDASLLVVLLLGVDRVTDSSSMADFHHCNLQTVWEEELGGSFGNWTRGVLDKVGYDDDTVQRFDWILQPLVERGLADVLQISTLLEDLDFHTAQDGRDAEKILLKSLERFGLPQFNNFRFPTSRAFSVYLDDAVAFFSYDAFLEERNREKSLKAIETFERSKEAELDEVFDPHDRSPFATDQEFLDGIRQYVRTGDRAVRERLLQCDFVIIRDEILAFRPPKERKEAKERIKKLSGGPVEVILSALWATLGEFKRAADDRGMFANDILKSIEIESQLFKHDSDGESSEERRHNALIYLGRLLGGVDQFIQKYLGDSHLGDNRRILSRLVRPDVDCQSARTAEPYLQFVVSLNGDGLDKPISKQFAWRLPEIQSYRVADELIQWAAGRLTRADGFCLPVFHVTYYEELLLAKDDEESRRVLLHCVQDEGGSLRNLIKNRDLDSHDEILKRVKKLAFDYDHFLQKAKMEGLHAALFADWDNVRKAYEQAFDAYLNETSSGRSPLAALLFRSFLIITSREMAEGDRWMWEPHEASCVVTVLHPALLEMLQAHIHYLLTSFTTVAARELLAPGTRSFRDLVWQGYVDLAAIQMPLSGLIKDRNRVLDTDIRGEGLIHRIGSPGDKEGSLTTRLLLRYDAFDEDDISDAELFGRSRESMLLVRILQDYRKLHPHADDGLTIAVYQNENIQHVIAAVDEYLKDVCTGRPQSMKNYSLAVTLFTESSDDSSVTRWVGQWKERWEVAESQTSLSHYRRANLVVAHRVVSPDNHYRQFTQLVADRLQVDVVFLNGFIRAGSQGNDFELVEPYDVLARTLKFPILEKPFCVFRDPSRRLQRARVLSNRQFRLTTCHAELMARLKSREVPQTTHHVVLGYGDYAPWQGVVDALHRVAEWVVCIDPNIDERLIAEKGTDAHEAREIIGFGSGVGTHGEANFTVSTEQFHHSDVLRKLEASIREVYNGWNADTYQTVAQKVLAESRRLSGLSLVRATGVGQYIRDFMAYAVTRKLLRTHGDVLCDQIVSLDAYQHWFDSAESGTRPDLLWLVARIDANGRLQLDMRLVECKLAKASDAHLQKAREQLENGIRHFVAAFMPDIEGGSAEDERPDQRYWWLQLYRLIASKAEITERDQRRVLTSLERLAEGEYDIVWRAAAITYWTDDNSDGISQSGTWTYAFDGKELGINVLSAGSEFVRTLCEKGSGVDLPWESDVVVFRAALPRPPVEEFEPEQKSSQTSPRRELDLPALPEASKPGLKVPAIPKTEINPTVRVIPDRILLGTASPGSRKVYWEFGHKELTNRHLIIFGSSGMGKTYTIQCLLFELGRTGQNSLIVDYTNGFFENQLEPEFKGLLSPVQHVVRREPLAINPFRQQSDVIGEELLPEVPSSTAQRVSGVFSEVYNFGDQQKSALYQAVKSGLEARLYTSLPSQGPTRGSAMTLEDLIPRLEILAEEKGTQAQSANSVISKLRPFLDQNPFGTEDPQSWERLFVDTIHRCHIIQLAGFMKDAARLVTEFSLIDLYWFYRARGTQASPRVVVLDEVQNLDHREESPLAQLLREGRKFGFALILATQIMSNLEKDERDRLFLAAHKLFFRPADTEMRTYAEIASVNTGEKVDDWLKKLSALKRGECYSLGPSLNETTGKLEIKAFKISITTLADRIGDA